jgi:hypothetical protein
MLLISILAKNVHRCSLCLILFITACSGDNANNNAIEVTPAVIYSVSFSGSGGGSVDNFGGDFKEGTQLTVTATADEGFLFTRWSDGSVENPREITVDSYLSLTANFLSALNLNLRVHIMQSEPWVHRSDTSMASWVKSDVVTNEIIPELNSIWQVAGIVWHVENIIEEPIVTYWGYEEDIKYIVDSERDGMGRSDPARLPLLYNLMQPNYRSTNDVVDGNLFHIYLFPFIGNTSQGNAMGNFGWHSVVGTWSNKHNYGGTPEVTLLAEDKTNFVRGSLSRTIAHELGHVLSLKHDCENCLMRGKGYQMFQYQIDGSRNAAIERLSNAP